MSDKFPFPTENRTEGHINLTIPQLKLYAKTPSEYIPSKAPVFYNPLMEMNRDIAVLSLKVYQGRMGKRLRICDPLAGCGVRGLRFAKEVGEVEEVILNDINLEAVKLAQFNIGLNDLSSLVNVKNGDANVFLNESSFPEKRYDVIDVDPYGSPTSFLESAVRALKNGGLIALTATDMAVLCGVKALVCTRKYFGTPLRTEYCHELAIRLLINALVFSAGRHDRGVNILFSHYTGHYVRVYAQILYGKLKANASIKKLGYILHCFNCLNRKWMFNIPCLTDGKCDVCGNKMRIAGPLWLGKLLNSQFCTDMLTEINKEENKEKKKELIKLLEIIEMEVNALPTYYVIDKICKKIKSNVPAKQKVITMIREEGYDAVSTHFNPIGIKTNATIERVKKSIKNAL
jgi:tRNA (guanine26-N2/guanine27-N2)-dimethyltransferase